MQRRRGIRRSNRYILRHSGVSRTGGSTRTNIHKSSGLVGPGSAHLRDARRRVAVPRRRRRGDIRGDHARRSQVSALPLHGVRGHHEASLAQERRASPRFDWTRRRRCQEAGVLPKHRLGWPIEEARSTAFCSYNCNNRHFHNLQNLIIPCQYNSFFLSLEIARRRKQLWRGVYSRRTGSNATQRLQTYSRWRSD